MWNVVLLTAFLQLPDRRLLLFFSLLFLLVINCAAEGTNSQRFRRRVIVGNPCWRLECPQVSSTGLLKALEFKANRRAEDASCQECRVLSFMFSMQVLLNPPSHVLPRGLDGEIIPFSLWSIPVLRVKRGTLGHCFPWFSHLCWQLWVELLLSEVKWKQI